MTGNPTTPEPLSGDEKRRLNTRIGGIAGVVLGYALVQAANVPFGAGPPITYSTAGQIISVGAFVLVLPLLHFGTKWVVNPGERGDSE